MFQGGLILELRALISLKPNSRPAALPFSRRAPPPPPSHACTRMTRCTGTCMGHVTTSSNQGWQDCVVIESSKAESCVGNLILLSVMNRFAAPARDGGASGTELKNPPPPRQEQSLLSLRFHVNRCQSGPARLQLCRAALVSAPLSPTYPQICRICIRWVLTNP